jgi:hypothetical protein
MQWFPDYNFILASKSPRRQELLKSLGIDFVIHTKDVEEISEECFNSRDELFDENVDESRKKELLTAIATYDDVKAYRTLEKFVDNATGEIKQWGILAMQESRMLLQNSLLDENQVFISTGLGGKGKKLRYFVVFISHDENSLLTSIQQKLVTDELIFELKKHEGEFESIDFTEGFASSLVMLPITVNIQQVFRNVIEECNQYGNFLRKDMVITNVKIMSRLEIIQLLQQKNKSSRNELDRE